MAFFLFHLIYYYYYYYFVFSILLRDQLAWLIILVKADLEMV